MAGGRLAGCLVGRLIGCLVVWLIGRLVSQLVDLAVSVWSAGRSVVPAFVYVGWWAGTQGKRA